MRGEHSKLSCQKESLILNHQSSPTASAPPTPSFLTSAAVGSAFLSPHWQSSSKLVSYTANSFSLNRRNMKSDVFASTITIAEIMPLNRSIGEKSGSFLNDSEVTPQLTLPFLPFISLNKWCIFSNLFNIYKGQQRPDDIAFERKSNPLAAVCWSLP